MYKWCESKDGRGIEGLAPFIWLLMGTLLALAAASFLLWWIPTMGLGNINRLLPFILASVLIAAFLFLLASASLIAASAAGYDVPLSGKLRGLLIKVFLPFMTFLAGIVRIDKLKIHRAFLDINNRLVRSMSLKTRPDSFLILMPHCLQFQDCKFKVTKDIELCGECGKCEIVELLYLGREYGIKMFVNTGGTSARKIIMERRPRAVVAVACERDLVSGITDSYPLPVVGITNIRPEGYCINTHVEVERVKDAVRSFLGEPVTKA